MLRALALTAALVLPAARDAGAQDRFTPVIAGAPESTVRNGYVVNHRREAVQRELTARPPTEAELGVRLPPGAQLRHELSARQIVQYHPVWRIYQYRVALPKEELARHFTAQGLRYEASEGRAYFPNATRDRGDFIDGLGDAALTGLRIWRALPEGAAGRR
jgi:hypothetical protein